jgi:WD40 repeat protein
MFISVDSKSQVSASSTKSIEWASMTCLFGWPVQGIWPGLDYTDVNAVDRSRNGLLLATGDDFGQVKLFKYPCVKEQAGFNEFYGHSSHVTGVKFTANDTFVISTGGNDKTVMVWDTDINDDDQQYFNGQ